LDRGRLETGRNRDQFLNEKNNKKTNIMIDTAGCNSEVSVNP